MDNSGMGRRAAARRLSIMVALGCAAVGGGVTSPGCAEFDTTPVPVTHGSLGEEIVQVFCERIAADAERARPEGEPRDVSGARWKPVCEGNAPVPADAPPRLAALMENRARLAEALDRTLPEAMSDDLGLFMGELLPFFDTPEERLPTQTRRLADFLERLSRDDEAVAALERLGTREGYRPLRLALGVTRPTLAYPRFDEFAEVALRTLLEGSAREELLDLQAALALEMATMEIDPRDDASDQTTLALMRQLMFTEDDLFATGGPSPVLLRDARGIALPNPAVSLSPFVDMDADGMADVDGLGRFVDASGATLSVPPPFRVQHESGVPRDPSGRAIRSDGTRYYAYIDASRTMLAGTTAELAPWFDPASPTLMQMSRGLPVLLGPPADTSFTYGAFTHRYSGFDTSQGPMFDAVHAIGELMHRDETEAALLATEALLRDHESAAAGIVRSARFMANESDLHPEAVLTQPNVFWDDLIDVLVRMSQRPGMLEALMRSFSDPRSENGGELFGAFMRHRDRVTFDPRDVNGPPLGLPLDEPVNRGMPDSFDNESMWQRTVALIDALNGVQVCNRAGARLDLRISLGPFSFNLRYPLFGRTAGRCELIRIDNVAEAYARAIMGDYELELQDGFLDAMVNVASALRVDVDEALEVSSGIDGLTRHPSPQALNRLVFWGLSDETGLRSCTPNAEGGDCNSTFAGQVFDPVRDRHGNLVIERYHGTIFAWESPGFYEAMQPLVEVLHQPGYTYDAEGSYFFGELLGTLHAHWASPANDQYCQAPACGPGDANFSHASNVRGYEELVAAGFEEGQLTQRLHRMNLALEAIEVEPGVDGVAALAAAGEVMIDPRRNVGLTDRFGNGTTRTNDGARELTQTPLYLLLDALSAMDTAWEREPERRAEFLLARRAMAEQFFGTRTLGDGFRLENQRGRAILLTALPFMRDRIADHRAQGDLLEWATGLDQRMEETMREPLMAALVRLLDAVNQDPDARTALAQLLGYLVDEASENDAFASVLYGGADALMVLEDDRNIVPLLNALSTGLAPNAREVVTGGASSLDLEGSALIDALDLVQDIQAVDEDRTLRRILQNAVSLPAAGDPVTPLETILDVIAEVNRAAPNAGGSLRADDYRAVFGQVTDFMLDEDHGLERLNGVVQHRRCFPEHGTACGAMGAAMESTGLCYEGASCQCTDMGGSLQWRCARP